MRGTNRSRADRDLDDGFEVVGILEAGHVAAVRHDLIGDGIVKVKDIFDDILGIVLDQTFFLSLFYEREDFFLGLCLLGFVILRAEQALDKALFFFT